MQTASDNEDYERLFGSPEENQARLADMWAKSDRAKEMFVAAQVEDIRAGRNFWRLIDDPYLDDWERNSQEEWKQLTHGDLPGVIIRVRLAVTDEGLACTGLHLEREREALTARDLRAIKIRPLLNGALAGWSDYLRLFSTETTTRPAKPGRRGYDDEFWVDIHKRYLRHKRDNPRRFIKAMRAEWPIKDRPSEPTVRRWVKTVEAKIANGELP